MRAPRAWNDPMHLTRVAWLDLETTGTDPNTDEIQQIGVTIRQRNMTVRQWSADVRTARPPSAEAAAIHGLDHTQGVDIADADAALSRELHRGTIDAIGGWAWSVFDGLFVRRWLPKTAALMKAQSLAQLDPCGWPCEPGHPLCRHLRCIALHVGVPVDENRLHNALYDADLVARTAEGMLRGFGLHMAALGLLHGWSMVAPLARIQAMRCREGLGAMACAAAVVAPDTDGSPPSIEVH